MGDLGPQLRIGEKPALQGIRDLSVQLGAATGGKIGVDRLAHQRVGELIASTDLGQQSGGRRGVQNVQHLGHRGTGDGHDQPRVDGTTGNRGDRQHGACAWLEPTEPQPEDIRDPFRYGDPGGVGRRGDAAGPEQPAEFEDEERVALGPRGDHVGERGRGVVQLADSNSETSAGPSPSSRIRSAPLRARPARAEVKASLTRTSAVRRVAMISTGASSDSAA